MSFQNFFSDLKSNNNHTFSFIFQEFLCTWFIDIDDTQNTMERPNKQGKSSFIYIYMYV